MSLLLPLLLPLLSAGLAGAGPHSAVHARIARAIELPLAVRALRHAGALEVDVRLALDAHRRHRLHAGDALVVFEEYTRIVDARGPVQGFGPFVVSRLDDGARGPALAKAIRRERWKARGEATGREDGPGKHDGKHLADVGGRGVWDVTGPHGRGQWSVVGVRRGGNGNANGHGRGHGRK